MREGKMNAAEKKIDRKAVKIRRMVPDDVAPRLSISWANLPRKEMVVSQLGGALDLSLLAEYEGVLVGFVLARLIYASLPMRGTGTIFYIAVNPDYRECGISNMLINQLKSDCRSKGIETLCSFIPENDANVVKYFEKIGFHRSDIINYHCPV
jgi:ribosomal protein S18 acetylase RimI-like enzyme